MKKKKQTKRKLKKSTKKKITKKQNPLRLSKRKSAYHPDENTIERNRYLEPFSRDREDWIERKLRSGNLTEEELFEQYSEGRSPLPVSISSSRKLRPLTRREQIAQMQEERQNNFFKQFRK